MGQTACCEGDPNNPNSIYDNTKPMMTTPPRSSRRSTKNSPQSPKYRESTLLNETSPYVK